MDNKMIFSLALGLERPWQLTKVGFIENKEGEQELHIEIGFERGYKFVGSDEGAYTSYDTRLRRWRHLNFFQYKCYIICRVPRIKLNDGGIEQVQVPWSRPGTGFTLLFEAFALQLIKCEMPVNKAAETLGEYPNRIWTIFNHYLDKEYENLDHSQITEIGLDETSIRKGHKYITVAVDMQTNQVFHVTAGKDKESVEKIQKYLESKGCEADQITCLSMDMSPSYISAGLEQFPKANITFDKFHVKKLLNEAMDQVRRAERREHVILKGHKYTFLKSQNKLSDKSIKQRDELIKLLPILGEAYRLKILFDDFWDFEEVEQADAFLEKWCKQVDKARIIPFQKFVQTLRAHWYGITQYILSRQTNAILESINAKIQLAKRRARGYRNFKNLKNMIYFLTAGIKIHPHRSA